MKIIFSILSISMLLSVCGQKIDKDNIYYKVHEAAKQAQADDANGLKNLYKMSLENHRDAELSQMMVKAVSLAMLKSGSKSLNNYFTTVKQNFSGNDFFSYLDNKPFQEDCSKCSGSGTNPCHTCDEGVCRNCKGKRSFMVKKAGNVTMKKACNSCNKTGKCQTCKGSGQSEKMCRTCNGKGTLFTREAVPDEYKKSLNHIVKNVPEMAAWKGIFIVAGIDKVIKKKKMALASKKQAAALARQNMPVKNDADLKHPLLEFNEYFRNRERIAKEKLYKTAKAKLVDDKPTITVEVEPTVARANSSLKLQYLEAFYQFWKLRCKFNSLGEDVGFVATYKGKKIAEFKGRKIVGL